CGCGPEGRADVAGAAAQGHGVVDERDVEPSGGASPSRAVPHPRTVGASGVRVAVVIPYRGTDRYRKRAFARVHQQVRSLGFPVFVGDTGDEPFSIGRTWNALADEAGGWDYLVRWGADFLLENPHQVHAALTRAKGRGGYVSCAN